MMGHSTQETTAPIQNPEHFNQAVSFTACLGDHFHVEGETPAEINRIRKITSSKE
jgi:hypothetical protein